MRAEQEAAALAAELRLLQAAGPSGAENGALRGDAGGHSNSRSNGSSDAQVLLWAVLIAATLPAATAKAPLTHLRRCS